MNKVYLFVPLMFYSIPSDFLFVTFIGKVKLFYFSENIKSNERNIS